MSQRYCFLIVQGDKAFPLEARKERSAKRALLDGYGPYERCMNLSQAAGVRRIVGISGFVLGEVLDAGCNAEGAIATDE